MQRTNVYLEEEQSDALRKVAQSQGVSMAELIRRSIGRILGEEEQSGDLDSDLAAIQESFGVMAGSGDNEFLTRSPGGREDHLERVRSR